MTDEQQKTPKDEPRKTPTSGRTLRRLRAQFRAELLGKAKPTPSDQTLIDLAAQAALRVREMRAEIAAGNRVPDEDLVRISNTVNRIMREFRGRKQTATDDDWQTGLWNMVKRDDDGESEAAA
jgi:hypothetical protein